MKETHTAPPPKLDDKERAALKLRSDEQMAAAKLAFAEGFFNAAASRAYYAVYSAMWRYMGYTPHGENQSKGEWGHSQLQYAFATQYSKMNSFSITQKISLEADIGAVLRGRKQADYGFTGVKKDKCAEIIRQAEELLMVISN